ncbi:ExbD/TolR family protein [Aureispira anguillae]|uniref:Biopolymer transporter ExbD n=1 Tax=Aureispira anguillae TaxID=2864201 RepID=A0A915YCY7_9BACT|nr:biopolymer transporter ExbD [Aureispira anguillae]BDS10799.1 biopolymer transporter ExbD [Aureispira anguillae]
MGLKKRTKVSAEFNMSSLTDIIFLLLIFFMLTSSLVSPTAINLKLPNSSKSTPSKQKVEGPIKLDINKRKEYTVNGRRLAEDAVRGKLAGIISKDRRKPEDITIILSIHESVDAQTLVTNVDMLNDFGVKMILATKLSS